MDDQESDRGSFSRRTFALLASTTGLLLVSSVPGGAEPLLDELEERTILTLARVISVVPVPFPTFGEASPATTHATSPRLMAAAGRLAPERLKAVRQGVSALAVSALKGEVEHERIVLKVADFVRNHGPAAVKAPVGLAVATLSRNFDPNSDAAAELWLSFADKYRMRTAE
ncbi:hypothetical protein ACXIZN_04290 [Amycolatopsis sp. TRM77291]